MADFQAIHDDFGPPNGQSGSMDDTYSDRGTQNWMAAKVAL